MDTVPSKGKKRSEEGNVTPASPSVNAVQSIKIRNDSLDWALAGGIRCGYITELFGEGGSGKTQICLQLALNVQLPPQMGGLYGVAIYYYCDYSFPTRRLEQMRDAMYLKLSIDNEMVNLDNIILCKVQNCNELNYKLNELERESEERSETPRHVRLVVIDSIASLCRSQFVNTREGMGERKWFFKTITGKLRKYARSYNIAVVITNQVTDVLDGATDTSTNGVFSLVYGHRIQPSLGAGWSACIDNRIFLGIAGQEEEVGEEGKSNRCMKIVFSPYLSRCECAFSITREGVV